MVLINKIYGGNHMRIKKITKAIVCMSLALSIVCGQYIPVSAQETNDRIYKRVSDDTVSATIVVEENADYEVVLEITEVDEESGGAYGHFSVRYRVDTGYVNANGVRLRSQPSLSATILELMYFNDVVYIHNFEYNSDGSWIHITRESTTTEGYVYAMYIDLETAC